MELLPYTLDPIREPLIAVPDVANAAWPHWRSSVPTLINGTTKLRELRTSDSLSLLAMLTSKEVGKFISPLPATKAGFEEFIKGTLQERAAGQGVCFGIVPDGYDTPIGLFQIQIRNGRTPEWDCAMGSPFWGTGLFMEGADAVLDFGFNGMGFDEIGARAVIENGRGNGALRKAGAVCERIIPEGLIKNGEPLDQYYWTVYADRRTRKKIAWDAPSC